MLTTIISLKITSKILFVLKIFLIKYVKKTVVRPKIKEITVIEKSLRKVKFQDKHQMSTLDLNLKCEDLP